MVQDLGTVVLLDSFVLLGIFSGYLAFNVIIGCTIPLVIIM